MPAVLKLWRKPERWLPRCEVCMHLTRTLAHHLVLEDAAGREVWVERSEGWVCAAKGGLGGGSAAPSEWIGWRLDWASAPEGSWVDAAGGRGSSGT